MYLERTIFTFLDILSSFTQNMPGRILAVYNEVKITDSFLSDTLFGCLNDEVVYTFLNILKNKSKVSSIMLIVSNVAHGTLPGRGRVGISIFKKTKEYA